MDSTHIRWIGKSLKKKYSSKDPKGRKWKNRKRQREHNRKEKPKRAPVVPNRRDP
jgi:hypothetical protein